MEPQLAHELAHLWEGWYSLPLQGNRRLDTTRI
jgi:hypothetical protein